MTVGRFLVLAAFSLLIGAALGRRNSRLWVALTVGGMAAALAAALLVGCGAQDWEWRSSFAPGGEPVHLRLDGLSALFLGLLSVIGGASAVFSSGYWADQDHPGSAPSKPDVDERAPCHHGFRAAGIERAALSDRMGAFHGQRLFPDNARPPAQGGAGGRLAVPGGLARRARCAFLRSLRPCRCARGPGISVPCAGAPTWRRCSGLPSLGSA